MSKILPPIVSEFEAQEAADSYDQWFGVKVQQAMHDPRQSIAHDEVVRRMQQRFAKLHEQSTLKG